MKFRIIEEREGEFYCQIKRYWFSSWKYIIKFNYQDNIFSKQTVHAEKFSSYNDAISLITETKNEILKRNNYPKIHKVNNEY